MINRIQPAASLKAIRSMRKSVVVADSKPKIGGLACNQKVGERKEVASSGKVFKVSETSFHVLKSTNYFSSPYESPIFYYDRESLTESSSSWFWTKEVLHVLV